MNACHVFDRDQRQQLRQNTIIDYVSRYGASLRKQVKKMEVSQHARYICTFCGKNTVRRQAVGIWNCKGCGSTLSRTQFPSFIQSRCAMANTYLQSALPVVLTPSPPPLPPLLARPSVVSVKLLRFKKSDACGFLYLLRSRLNTKNEKRNLKDFYDYTSPRELPVTMRQTRQHHSSLSHASENHVLD